MEMPRIKNSVTPPPSWCMAWFHQQGLTVRLWANLDHRASRELHSVNMASHLWASFSLLCPVPSPARLSQVTCGQRPVSFMQRGDAWSNTKSALCWLVLLAALCCAAKRQGFHRAKLTFQPQLNVSELRFPISAQQVLIHHRSPVPPASEFV